MTAEEQVVTPERLSQGINWQQWMEQIDRNEEKFQSNYDDHKLDADDVAAIKAAVEKAGGVTALALGEAWCPDVVRGRVALVDGADLGRRRGVDDRAGVAAVAALHGASV